MSSVQSEAAWTIHVWDMVDTKTNRPSTPLQIGHSTHYHYGFNPLPPPGYPDFSRSGKSAAEFAQEPSQFARMAPRPSTRRGRPAPPTPRIWLTAGVLLAVACQGGGERPLETSPGLSLAPWGLAEPAAAAARASEPVIAQPAVGQIRTSGAVPRAPGGEAACPHRSPNPIIALLRTCSFHCWPRRRGQRWPEHSLNVAISTRECYWTTPRDHRTHPPAALSPSRRLRGSAYHHVLSASGANTALLRGQKPTRARGRHGQKEAWGVGYTPSAGGRELSFGQRKAVPGRLPSV